LTVPFTHEEIDKIVSDMPTDKAQTKPRDQMVLQVCSSKFAGQSLNMIFISYVKNFGKEE
jgi:hypothetical protein